MSAVAVRKLGAWSIAAVVVATTGALYPWATHGHSAPAAFTGVFEQETIRVISRSGGVVIEVTGHEGDNVQPGDTLLRLENSDLQYRQRQLEQLRRKSGSVKSAASVMNSLTPRALQQMVEATPEVALAEREYVVALAIAESKPSPQTEQDLRAAARRREVVRKDAARTFQEASTSAGSVAEGLNDGMRAIQSELEKSHVLAPLAGTIEILQLRPGDLIAPGQPVASIAVAGRFYVDLHIEASQLAHFQEGRSVHVQTASHTVIPARIQHVSRQMDPQSGLFEIRIEVRQSQPGPQPGTRVEVLP